MVESALVQVKHCQPGPRMTPTHAPAVSRQAQEEQMIDCDTAPGKAGLEHG